MSLLGPEPEKLAPLPRELLAGLSTLLDLLDLPLLDRAMTKASPRDDGVEVVLAHSTEIACSIWVQAERETVLVGCAAMHETLIDARAALALIAALLSGQREVETYDGRPLRPDFTVAA